MLQKMRERFATQVTTSLVHFPLPYHANAIKAATIAECARTSNVFPQVSALLFSLRDSLASVDGETIVSRIPLQEPAAFRRCAAQQDTVVQVRRGLEHVERLAIRGTPTLVVNGTLLRDVPTEEQLDSVIIRALAARSR